MVVSSTVLNGAMNGHLVRFIPSSCVAAFSVPLNVGGCSTAKPFFVADLRDRRRRKKIRNLILSWLLRLCHRWSHCLCNRPEPQSLPDSSICFSPNGSLSNPPDHFC